MEEISGSEPKNLQKRPRYSIKLVNGVAASVALISAIGALFGFLVSQVDSVGHLNDITKNTEYRLHELEGQLLVLSRRLDTVEVGPNQVLPPDSAAVNTLKDEVAALRASVDNLNAAILSDPIKALAVPMIRRDLDALTRTAGEDLDVVREEVARIYDLTKWFLGLMFSMALAMLTVVIANSKSGKS
jgi:hypothetical protein